jgi:hypothetical protein
LLCFPPASAWEGKSPANPSNPSAPRLVDCIARFSSKESVQRP